MGGPKQLTVREWGGPQQRYLREVGWALTDVCESAGGIVTCKGLTCRCIQLFPAAVTDYILS